MTDNSRPWDERHNCHRRLLIALRREMENRPKVDGLSWIENERLAITMEANAWSAAHGLGVWLTVHDVERVEHRACGHIDYASKLALYVTDLLYQPQALACTSAPEAPDAI